VVEAGEGVIKKAPRHQGIEASRKRREEKTSADYADFLRGILYEGIERKMQREESREWKEIRMEEN